MVALNQTKENQHFAKNTKIRAPAVVLEPMMNLQEKAKKTTKTNCGSTALWSDHVLCLLPLGRLPAGLPDPSSWLGKKRLLRYI